ncbi:MAG TPA: Gfo/Idh/MocA family oxidoreductase [Planctomycetes bacterium]|nr:Gfo/Idh/MocA family oxidoreductase [Planctomycetota bacterium]HIN81285.1 Gfo/Idh/MocA family oxidoreductase [Planctomycetota bacterium]
MKKQTRRQFMSAAVAAAATVTIVPSYCLGRTSERLAPSDTLYFAKIACGGQGGGDFRSVLSAGALPSALCDIDSVRAAGVVNHEASVNLKLYSDYRKMFDEQAKNFDAVVVSTPDHMHAPISMDAMQLGKHVYCQKPLARTIQECYEMRDAAEKYGVITQMGNQGHSSGNLESTIEHVKSGVIGTVREAHVWTDRAQNWWPQGETVFLPKEKSQVPANVDWNSFLGVAPFTPYSSRIHPFKWRGFVDFGCGAIGDMACHNMDPAFMALDLGQPTSVKVECSEFNRVSFPAWTIVEWGFPARGDRAAVKVFWYDGGKKPERPTDMPEEMNLGGNGCLFIGDKGKMLGGSHARFCQPFAKDFEPPERTLPRSEGHYKEWVMACKGEKINRGTPGSNFGYAGPMTATILMGVVGMYFPGETLEWDGKKLEFKKKEANQYLHRAYRKGFEQ